MKYLSIVSLFIAFFISSGHTNTDKYQNHHFPKNWDTAGVFENKKVITWVQFNNTIKHKWYRECIVVEIGKDTLGKQTYTISNYSYNPVIDSMFSSGWEIQFSCEIVPIKNRFSSKMVFLDNIKTYNYKPDSAEVYKLLKEWGFTIYQNEYRTSVLGIDAKLWEEILGWKPERKRLVNEQSYVRGNTIQSYFGEINLNKH